MKSNNSSTLNPKQEELVKRLEKIRQNRQPKSEPRNKNIQQKKRKRNKSQNTTPSKIQSKIFEERFQSNSQVVKKPSKNKKKGKKTSSLPLLENLKDGEQLAQAVVLSEILSKPIALRKHQR